MSLYNIQCIMLFPNLEESQWSVEPSEMDSEEINSYTTLLLLSF